MKKRIPNNNQINIAKINQQLDALSKNMKSAVSAGNYAQGLAFCEQAIRLAPRAVMPWIDAAACCCYTNKWQKALEYGKKALKLGGDTLALYDALSHASGAIYDFENCKKWGNAALSKRLEVFNNEPAIEHNVHVAIPEAPCTATKHNNIIAFSLFGSNPKYCEGAVMNVIKSQEIYPSWTVHLWLDDTVPELVIKRIISNGGVVHQVTDQDKIGVPGPAWRFYAIDDVQDAHRIIFRDSDSLVSIREQEAVEEWVLSDKHFHIIRDGGSHTELILAGLWGMVACSTPQVRKLFNIFRSKPLESEHFGDQYFLREYVWPYVKQSLLSHDSKFDFMNPKPFPHEVDYRIFHVGMTEKLANMDISLQLADGINLRWTLRDEQNQDVCSYISSVQNGKIVVQVPAQYGVNLQSRLWSIHFENVDSNNPMPSLVKDSV